MTNSAVICKNLGKRYVIGKRQGSYKTLRDAVTGMISSPFHRAKRVLHGASLMLGGETIWALEDASFEIKHGDVVAVIGRNGAGKSTLLKILSRIVEPSCGFAETRGRVGSLLEVGTGFHPELTGRENVFLNGAILGMTKTEILRKFDAIVAFSEVEKFIDTPVKYYSSGMYVRLAFAVAAHLDPEILILDEVLAVGDMAFQKKCLGKIHEVNRSGRTVIMVSHNISVAQSFCHRGIVLERGKVAIDGGIQEAVDYYLHSVSAGGKTEFSHSVDLRDALGRPSRYRPLLKRVEFFDAKGAPLSGSVPMGAELKVRLFFHLEQPTAGVNFGLGFDNLLGQRVFTAHTSFERARNWGALNGHQCFECRIPTVTLVPGEYKIRIGMSIDMQDVDIIEDAASLRVVESDFYGTGRVPWNGTCVIPHQWRCIRAGLSEEDDLSTAMVSSNPTVVLRPAETERPGD
jgi:homopolymeric O-antigen transport system ATP-binding protein